MLSHGQMSGIYFRCVFAISDGETKSTFGGISKVAGPRCLEGGVAKVAGIGCLVVC